MPHYFFVQSEAEDASDPVICSSQQSDLAAAEQTGLEILRHSIASRDPARLPDSIVVEIWGESGGLLSTVLGRNEVGSPACS